MRTANTNYNLTTDNIIKVKIALEAMDKTIYSHIPQGITNEYDKSKNMLINWLEEMEYEISNYKTCKC